MILKRIGELELECCPSSQTYHLSIKHDNGDFVIIEEHQIDDLFAFLKQVKEHRDAGNQETESDSSFERSGNSYTDDVG